MGDVMLHRNYQTILGARNLAHSLDADRWRFRVETLCEFAALIACLGIIFVGWYSAAGWLDAIRGWMS